MLYSFIQISFPKSAKTNLLAPGIWKKFLGDKFTSYLSQLHRWSIAADRRVRILNVNFNLMRTRKKIVIHLFTIDTPSFHTSIRCCWRLYKFWWRTNHCILPVYVLLNVGYEVIPLDALSSNWLPFVHTSHCWNERICSTNSSEARRCDDCSDCWSTPLLVHQTCLAPDSIKVENICLKVL
jgi:hypothetical protein